MTRLLPLLLPLAAAVLLGAGWGDSGDPAPAAAVRTDTVSRTTRVEVVKQAAAARGQAFDPEGIYRRESPGIVTVISTGLATAGDKDAEGLGSGFVITGDGEVATNAHVVTSGTGDAIRKAREVFVKFSDDNQVPAKVVGFDPFADVALLKIDPAGLDLRPLPLGSTRSLQVGAPVAAIGSPFGEEQSLSIGVISALDRSIESLTGFSTSGAIQTDAAINHGNSGGPLLDADGAVLGINSQIRTESGDGTGVGFAVPVDVVKRSLTQLREGGTVRYAYLGVSSAGVYPQLVQRFKLPAAHGAWVQGVSAGGPAAKAGIRAGDQDVRFQASAFKAGGDLIVGVGGTAIRDEDDLARALEDKQPGQSVDVDLFRDGRRLTVPVELGARPLEVPRG